MNCFKVSLSFAIGSHDKNWSINQTFNYLISIINGYKEHFVIGEKIELWKLFTLTRYLLSWKRFEYKQQY